MRAILLLVAALLCASPALAQQISVYFTMTGDDDVGVRLGYALKESIRRSSGMKLVDLEEDGRIAVRMVTINADSDRQGTQSQTIYSVVFTAETFHDTPVTMYLTNYVGYCGSSRIQSCAERLTAAADTQASRVRSMIRRSTGDRK
jgi:hypothetical protein